MDPARTSADSRCRCARIAAAGGIECTVSWTAAEDGQAGVTLNCNRDVDAPKAQRVVFLVAVLSDRSSS